MHPYVTTGKTLGLYEWKFVGNTMSVFEYAVQVGYKLSSKNQMPFNFIAAVTVYSEFGTQQKTKSFRVSIVSPTIFHKMKGTDAMGAEFQAKIFTLFHYRQEAL